MPRSLVVFYSRTGNTRSVAETIAAELGADLEEISDVHPRKGLISGWWRSIQDVRKGRDVEIRCSGLAPGDYDLVVLGTPVWAGRMSSPLQTYLARHKGEMPAMAAFVTEGGNGGLAAIDQIAALVGKKPLTDLIVRASEVKSGAHLKACRDFVRRLRGHMAETGGQPSIPPDVVEVPMPTGRP